jgi:DNA-binding CsgD family transcriptional regulator
VIGEMGISLDTVRTHLRRICGKMQVHAISEAVARAIRAGII